MKFKVPTTMNNVVKELILNTGSMEDEERQYWFDIWDHINESQQIKIQDILQTERDRLEALEKRYIDEISKLHQEYFNEVKDLSKEKIYNLIFN